MKSLSAKLWQSGQAGLASVAMFVAVTAGAQTPLVLNGDFESGSGISVPNWVLAGGAALNGAVGSSQYARSGSQYLILGAAVLEVDSTYQDVYLPNTATSAPFTFYYSITSSESTTTATNDTMTVTIRTTGGTVLTNLGTWSNLNKDSVAGTWHAVSCNALPYKGQMLRLFFSSINNSSASTAFRIDDVSLQANVPSPLVTTVAPSGVTSSTGTMNGSANPNGLSSGAFFQYGTTTGYGSVTTPILYGAGITTAQGIQATLTGLSAGMQIHYRAVAYSAAGTNGGNDASFTTTQPPPIVQTLSPGSFAPTSVQLNGSVDPNGATATFYFEYGPTVSYGYKTASGIAISSLSVSGPLNGLTPRSTYHYRMAAYNSGGTNYGADASFTATAMSGAVGKITPLCVYASDSPYTTIDLLVTHTSSAITAAGGWPVLQHRIVNAVADMNTAFVNSLITNRVRLLDIEAVSYLETGSAGTDVSRLVDPADGFLDDVQFRQSQLGADLVGLIVGNSDQGGISKQLTNISVAYKTNALVLVNYVAMANFMALAHELGHVMGAGHSWVTAEQLGTGGGVFPYSYGFQFTNNNHIYGDIMSYAAAYKGPDGQYGDILPYFSNPQASWAGILIGRAANLDHPADNATTLNITGPTAAQFAPTVVPSSSSVWVTNFGDSSLTISSIAMSPPASWVNIPTSFPIIISPGASAQISINIDFTKAPTSFSSTRMLLTSNGSSDPANDSEVLIMVDNHTPLSPPQVTVQPTAGGIQMNVNSRSQTLTTVWKSVDLQNWSQVFQTNSPDAFNLIESILPSEPKAFYKVSVQ
ncbi:MAG TPA: M12 family metallo-peptidase [Verrucomicrobiae bacterium]|nr:M12 family metallo-peptidase [Verrucomicrobiae bacterium]